MDQAPSVPFTCINMYSCLPKALRDRYNFHTHLIVGNTSSERLTEAWSMAVEAGHRDKAKSAPTGREQLLSGSQ